MESINAYRWRTQEEMDQGANDWQEFFNVDFDDIIQFGIENKIIRRRDGNIRKFSKSYYLITIDHAKFYLRDDKFKALKEKMKGKYTTRKNPIEEYKRTRYGLELRKAIDWTHDIIVKE